MQNMSTFHKLVAFMAKLVRRHTSNVEILGSTPSESIFFLVQMTIKIILYEPGKSLFIVFQSVKQSSYFH